MSWGKIDDKLHSHRKVLKVGRRGVDRLAAMGLWALCLSYTCDHNTDGFIDREIVVDIAGSEQLADRLAAQLVAAGFWTASSRGVEGMGMASCASGWAFHDWSRYNRDRETIAAEQERKREAGRKGGLARAGKIAGSASTREADTQAPAKQPASRLAEPVLVPSRPDPDPVPSRPVPKRDPPSGDRPRATRLSEDWEPSPELLAKIHRTQGVDPLSCVLPFRNHFVAMPDSNKNAKKLRWDLAFENWVHRDAGRLPQWSEPEVPLQRAPTKPLTAADVEEIERLKKQAFDGLDLAKRKATPFLFDDPPKEATP